MPGTGKATLLLTGATGFLGGAIAAALLDSPRWRELLILIRAADAAEGRTRLAQCMQRFALDAALVERIGDHQILCGDLCGAAQFADDPRLAAITEVVNCAAFASFSNHPQILRTNVEGTVGFARVIASRARLRRFIQVGTAMSCGADAPKLVLESYQPPADALQLVPYTASKLEGERQLREIPGLPLVIARPSIIVGHTRLGCRASASIFWVFRMARALRCFPCPADSRIDLVPVDYAAQAILRLLAAPQLAHQLYHISAGAQASCSYREIDAAIAMALGEAPTHDYRQLGYDVIRQEQERFDELFGPCLKPVMLRAIQLYGAFGSLGLLFDNARLLAEGVAAPPRFASYAGLCAVSAHGAPIASQMHYDFKGMPTRKRDAVKAAAAFSAP